MATQNVTVTATTNAVGVPTSSFSGSAYVGAHTYPPNSVPVTTLGGAHTHQVSPSSNPHLGGTWAINTTAAPTEGMVVTIKGKLYRFSEATDSWHEVIDATTEEIKAAPEIKVNLDGKAMLLALEAYESFLNDLLDSHMDNKTREVIYDTLHGLEESIEALQKL